LPSSASATSSNAFIILTAASVGILNEQAVLVYSGFNLMAALASYPAGLLSDAVRRKTVFLLDLGIFIARPPALGWQPRRGRSSCCSPSTVPIRASSGR
jgi:MFS family permease